MPPGYYGKGGQASAPPKGTNEPSDLDGPGMSSAPYDPGYSLDRSLQGCSIDHLKMGFKPKGRSA